MSTGCKIVSFDNFTNQTLLKAYRICLATFTCMLSSHLKVKRIAENVQKRDVNSFDKYWAGKFYGLHILSNYTKSSYPSYTVLLYLFCWIHLSLYTLYLDEDLVWVFLCVLPRIFLCYRVNRGGKLPSLSIVISLPRSSNNMPATRNLPEAQMPRVPERKKKPPHHSTNIASYCLVTANLKLAI